MEKLSLSLNLDRMILFGANEVNHFQTKITLSEEIHISQTLPHNKLNIHHIK